MLLDNVTALNEKKRTYIFPNNETIVLDNVEELIISDSANHRIKTADERLHIIPEKWLAIIIDDANWTQVSPNTPWVLKEKQRVYRFPGNNIITLNKVTELIVSDSGTHYLKTEDDKLYIITAGWIQITIDDKHWTV